METHGICVPIPRIPHSTSYIAHRQSRRNRAFHLICLDLRVLFSSSLHLEPVINTYSPVAMSSPAVGSESSIAVEMEETIARISSHKGVEGIMIMDQHGAYKLTVLQVGEIGPTRQFFRQLDQNVPRSVMSQQKNCHLPPQAP